MEWEFIYAMSSQGGIWSGCSLQQKMTSVSSIKKNWQVLTCYMTCPTYLIIADKNSVLEFMTNKRMTGVCRFSDFYRYLFVSVLVGS